MKKIYLSDKFILLVKYILVKQIKLIKNFLFDFIRKIYRYFTSLYIYIFFFI